MVKTQLSHLLHVIAADMRNSPRTRAIEEAKERIRRRQEWLQKCIAPPRAQLTLLNERQKDDGTGNENG